MLKHTLGYYQDAAGGSLMPAESALRPIANSDWWTSLSDYFDDLIWQYYADRQVFISDKFNPDDEAGTIANIKRAFAINLKSKAKIYEDLYKSTQLEYNPLYNVDATEHTERTLRQTGEGSHTKSGNDTITTSGSETDEKAGKEATTRTGSETDEKEGKEATTRTGDETDEKAGSEANTRTGDTTTSHLGDNTETVAKTTYDSSTFYDTQKTTITPGATDTEAYNNIADTTTFTDRIDTHTYNDVKDEVTFDDRVDTHTYTDVKDELTFDDRIDTHTYNDVAHETAYDSADTEERDFTDTEIIEHRRFGNIGVTMSSQLQEDFRRVSDWDFYKRVMSDCVNCVSYGLYL